MHATFKTKGAHIVNDCCALNYHLAFSLTAHHTALALIRGILEAQPHSSPSAHILLVMSLTEETEEDTNRSLSGDPAECQRGGLY